MAAPGSTRRGEEAHGGGAPQLRQADFEGGVVGLVAASAAITLAVTEPPPWLNREAYFLALSGVFFAGVTQVAASVWAADGRRGAAGRKLVYASLVVPLVVAGGLALAPLLM
ncbi:hypothetical protein ACP70R_030443 [Stipagrostis hirtigluma subsp. patula]